ncbi:MAG: DUF1844 domain-containing protein [Myxococcales bacterium]|nr:DUF1844 domain-containing protein [Myxococcales bacterium]
MSDSTGSDSKTKEMKETKGLPSIDFSTFVLSLSTSALYQMGLVNGPDGAPVGEQDLIMARQTIDTLKMLRVKTQGNLEEGELKLIDNLLYELHSRFVSL